MSQYREERDFLGSMKVPSGAYYGIFTKRALENFRISGLTIDREFISSLVEVKIAAAKANAELRLLDMEKTGAIVRSAQEILNGKFSDEFPLDVFQAGAGTPWNMNVNEVIANRANELLGSNLGAYDRVHPNDHVNMSQSSNDVVPTAARIATLKLGDELIGELKSLKKSLERKAEEFKRVMKSGRTHLRDAVPITVGQEFGAFASAVESARRRLEASRENLRKISLGGTAVGTGINTHPKYPYLALRYLKELTGLELQRARNFIEKTQFASDFLRAMDALGEMVVDLMKMGNDLMLLSSGPSTGLNELVLPPVEPGSSIMPGKVNPSIIECFNMVCFQVLGNRGAVEKASISGNLNLNVYVPLIAFNLLTSIRWLANAVQMLRERCIEGIEVREEVAERYFSQSNALATLLSPVLGYERAAELAGEALERKVSVLDLVLEKGILTEEEIDELIAHSPSPNMHIVERIRRRASEARGK